MKYQVSFEVEYEENPNYSNQRNSANALLFLFRKLKNTFAEVEPETFSIVEVK
jgi:hypothetical protein